MAWHFTEIDNDSRIVTDPTTLTVQSHGELTHLQIFVREVLQNSLDNRAGVEPIESRPGPTRQAGPQTALEPVRVDFRLRHLRGTERDRFLEALRFDQIAPHVRSVIQYEKKNRRRTDFPDPAEVSAKSFVLKLLYIEDFGTRGLVGPEHSREVDRFPQPHCFLGLCRNIGDSQKSSDAMGGTYGLGKTVLWKHSRFRIVMFHSRMSDPYIKEGSTQEHSTRFFGHVRLPGHDIKEKSYKGEGFWGRRSGDLTHSLMDEEADLCAKTFGMIGRRNNDFGTSVLVVDFEDPDASEEERDETATIDGIREAAEQYFWPAIVDQKLRVRARVEINDPKSWRVADVFTPAYLSPFIEAYSAAKQNKLRPHIILKQHEVNVPKGLGPEDEKCKSSIVVCAGLRMDEAAPPKYLNRTALIRGAGMVVGYQKIGRPGFGGSDFCAVVLAGKSVPSYLFIGEREQYRCEQLLAHSEPVTHDVWTPNSDKLKKWYGARAEVNRILEGIRRAIADATTTEVKPEGRAISLLSSLFPLSEGSYESDAIRDMQVEVLAEPELIESPDGTLRYEFEIRIHVPGRDDFFEMRKPARWKVEATYGFYGEDVRRKVVENAAISFTHVRRSGAGWAVLPERRPYFEAEVLPEEVQVELKGQTGLLESFLAVITRHELQIKVSKSW